MIVSRIKLLAEKIWAYHHMDHQLIKADAIIVLCSHDEMVAKKGAELFLDEWAPLLIFSGGLGAITRNFWTDPEADRFAAIALEMGVPAERIVIENQSTNTGDNVRFTKKLLLERNLDLKKFIIVQKPYMERRSYATFKQFWPEAEVVLTSPQVNFDEYLKTYSNRQLSADDVISIMVGDLHRIRFYPERGYQIAQDIPTDVWNAFEELVAAGYDRHLIAPK